MSKKQPKLKFEEEKERTATRSPPKKSKVEQSVPQKQKLKQDADKAAEKAQHLRFGKAEITPDEASRMTKQQKRAMYAAAAARSAVHREIDQYEDDNVGMQALSEGEKAAETAHDISKSRYARKLKKKAKIDRNAKGQQTVHFMNLVDEADLLTLMEEDAADAYTAEKEAAAQAEQDKLKAEEEAKKAAEEAAASGEEQPKENKVTKIASGFLGVVVLIALAAGGGFYAFTKQKQKKQAEKEALDPDANYTEDKGDFEIPVEDEPEEPGEEDTEPI